MSLRNLIYNLPMSGKLIAGLVAGVIIYILFRFLIYKVNQTARENGLIKKEHERYSEQQKLWNLMNMGRQ